jgi:hypothetical protein
MPTDGVAGVTIDSNNNLVVSATKSGGVFPDHADVAVLRYTVNGRSTRVLPLKARK